MAIETTYTLKATAQGFDAAGRAVDDLNKKATKGQREAADAIKRTRDELARLKKDFLDSMRSQQQGAAGAGGAAGLGPAIKPKRPRKPKNADMPDPRLVDAQGFGPAYDPEDLPPGTPGAGPGPRRPRRPRQAKAPMLDEGALSALKEAYNKATGSVLHFSQEVSDNTAILKDALPTLLAYAEALERSGRGGRSGGGGGGGGRGGGGGGGPRGPAIPPDPPGSAPPPGSSRFSFDRSAFRQGALESLVPGVGLLQRGGGIMSQVAGRAAGNFGRAAYMAPFSGVGGVQGLLGSVPIAGPVLAAMSGLQYGNAGSAIGFEQQQQQMLPFLGRTGVDDRRLGRRGTEISANVVGRQGMRMLGADQQGSQALLAQLAQASGTTADNYDVYNSFNGALAAQGAYGVGTDVAGSFVQGQRLAGAGGGRGGAGFMRSLSQASGGLGLNGSELINYMREMAEGIASFRETGIPIATDSIGAIGSSLKATGISGSRAGYLADQFQRTSQNIGMNGPQSFSDFRLLQAVSGKPLRGINDTLDASEQLEQGLSPEQSRGTLQRLMTNLQSTYGKGRAGQEISRQALAGYGIRLGRKEFRDLSAKGFSNVPEGDLAQYSQALANTAQGNVSNATSAQSNISNQNLALGQGGLETYFKTEGFQRNLATAVTQGMNPLVNVMVDAVQGLTRAISLGHIQGVTMSATQAAGR